jgi:D-alanine-D-alanine ligase
MNDRLKITVLVDAASVSAADPQFEHSPDEPITEYHVIESLRLLGHTASVVDVHDDLGDMIDKIKKSDPDLIFNLTEQFACLRSMDKNIAAVLEMLQIPFTGAGTTGLMLCRDKRLCKQLLARHLIRVPGFVNIPLGRRVRVPRAIRFPLVVKPALEDGSEGISNASLVWDEDALAERARFVHERWRQDAIAEEYIEGRELYVSILGNSRLTVLPIRECFLQKHPEGGPYMATYRVKWNESYRNKWAIEFGFADLDPKLHAHVARVCKKVYRLLHLQDYGRIDVRLAPDDRLVVLEANPNPGLAYGEEVAESAEKAGLEYEQFIHRLIKTALRRSPQN